MTVSWKERKDQVARYRVMEQETTDPLAAGLLHVIVSEMEADLIEVADVEAQRMLLQDCALWRKELKVGVAFGQGDAPVI